jgi:integrase-like protein
VVEFFTAQINNDHTRKAYLNAARRFTQWCEAHGLGELAQVEPFHVAAFVKELQGKFSPPTVKQHLAALRMLFDWLVTGHVAPVIEAVRADGITSLEGIAAELNARGILTPARQVVRNDSQECADTGVGLTPGRARASRREIRGRSCGAVRSRGSPERAQGRSARRPVDVSRAHGPTRNRHRAHP